MEFVVQAGDAFVGSANLVLHQLDVFDGALDLTCSDKPGRAIERESRLAARGSCHWR